jgi:hypothetical protein
VEHPRPRVRFGSVVPLARSAGVLPADE